jgi:hypothetical protein
MCGGCSRFYTSARRYTRVRSIFHRLHRQAVSFTRKFPPDWRPHDTQDLRRSSQRIEMLQEQVQEFAQGMSPLRPSF